MRGGGVPVSGIIPGSDVEIPAVPIRQRRADIRGAAGVGGCIGQGGIGGAPFEGIARNAAAAPIARARPAYIDSPVGGPGAQGVAGAAHARVGGRGAVIFERVECYPARKSDRCSLWSAPADSSCWGWRPRPGCIQRWWCS